MIPNPHGASTSAITPAATAKAVILAILFGAAVGALGRLILVWRASRLNPVEALRS